MGLFKKDKGRVYASVLDGLKQVYKEKLLPFEEHHRFQDFHSPLLTDSDFDAKPMILLVGQYSTGKTTFIRYLLERDFPGIHIGPEPTTDRFIAVMHGDRDNIVPGNALVVDPSRQFRPLSKFGNAFLNRLQCSLCDSPVLANMTIVDTPGILSGEKQRLDRGYDFTGVLKWFAERVDRIVLLFDAHKLDISDEFRRSIEALKGYDDKIRIVLNKADAVDHQQLMRVYGALMWSLGKVLQTPEVARVYIGSFWDRPLQHQTNKRLFVAEEQDLFRDLQQLPRSTVVRKLNDLIRRARLAKVHAYILSDLKKSMPAVFGKSSKQRKLTENLEMIYERLQAELQMSSSDFPDLERMREQLASADFAKFHAIRPKMVETVDRMLSEDVAALMARIADEDVDDRNGLVEGGAFANVVDETSPFGYMQGEGVNEGRASEEWIVLKGKEECDRVFEALRPVDGKLSGEHCREEFLKHKLPNSVLAKIWTLADVDRDGKLDADEFALAMHLIKVKTDNYDLPTKLPEHLVPPSKRRSRGSVA